MRSRDPVVLIRQARAGDAAATGRLISLVERDGDPAHRVAALTFAGGAALRRVIGVTGAPGAGKSTLTDRLMGQARRQGPVGVIAVDPSSPFSGGAVLGDRVRMSGHSGDGGVFIRSMATRGHVGGLSRAVPAAVRVLGAVGFPTVLVETVGVGQVEVDIAGAADTTIVVVNPGWGDSVQTSKAGLLEIADIFVINKADRPGAAETRRDLATLLDTDPEMGEWRPPIVLTTAATGEGVGELWDAVVNHGHHLEISGELKRRREQHLLDELHRALVTRLTNDVRTVAGGELYERAAAAVVAYELEPQAAAGELLRTLGLVSPRE